MKKLREEYLNEKDSKLKFESIPDIEDIKLKTLLSKLDRDKLIKCIDLNNDKYKLSYIEKLKLNTFDTDTGKVWKLKHQQMIQLLHILILINILLIY